MVGAVTILVSLLYAPLWGAEENKRSTKDAATDSVMVSLQALSKGVVSCVADVETVVTIEGQRVEIQGTGSFKLPNRMRVEKRLADGAREVSVSDGSYLWMYDVDENTVTRINLSSVYSATDVEADLDQFDPLRPFRGVEWESIRHAGEDTTGGATVQIFWARPLPNLLTTQLPTTIDRVELRVASKDGLLRSATLLNVDRNAVIVQRFKNIDSDQDVDDGRFRFVVPAGAHPVDATSEMIELLRPDTD